MSRGEDHDGVKARAALIDPESAKIVWSSDPQVAPGAPLTEFLPMAESLGAHDAMREVARSGEPRHLNTSVVSTARGSISLVVSIHRLPDDTLLVVTEHGWDASRQKAAGQHGRRSR